MRYCSMGLVAASLWALPTRADVVEPDHQPRDCPRGSQGSFPHALGPCIAEPCASDKDCPGNACVETALCIDGTEVVAECGSEDSCARGQCRRAKRCVSRSDTRTSPSKGTGAARRSCACSLPPSSSGDGAAALSVLILGGLMGARRRGRRRGKG